MTLCGRMGGVGLVEQLGSFLENNSKPYYMRLLKSMYPSDDAKFGNSVFLFNQHFLRHKREFKSKGIEHDIKNILLIQNLELPTIYNPDKPSIEDYLEGPNNWKEGHEGGNCIALSTIFIALADFFSVDQFDKYIFNFRTFKMKTNQSQSLPHLRIEVAKNVYNLSNDFNSIMPIHSDTDDEKFMTTRLTPKEYLGYEILLNAKKEDNLEIRQKLNSLSIKLSNGKLHFPSRASYYVNCLLSKLPSVPNPVNMIKYLKNTDVSSMYGTN